MECSLLLLLVAFARVQGYQRNLNGTVTDSYEYNSVTSENSHFKQFKIRDFDKVFQHYRSDQKRREPKFISFQTKDDNIEVEIDFAIPFLSIPVKRSLNGAFGTLKNVISGIPMANVNLGALLLTGFVVVGGAMIGGIARLLNGGHFIEVAGSMPWFRTRNMKQKQGDDGVSIENQWWRIIDQIDKALLKYEFDTTACTQRVICWHVKESSANVSEKRASSIDHIISGLTNSDWALQLIKSTAWNDAVAAGKKELNCESAFPSCKLSPNHLKMFTNNLKQLTNKK